MDLSVLDVLQIFGRAGRPGLEDSGEGYICTTHDKLDHYLDAVTAQVRGCYTIECNNILIGYIIEPN
jgi:replicative superfamily II helicase